MSAVTFDEYVYSNAHNDGKGIYLYIVAYYESISYKAMFGSRRQYLAALIGAMSSSGI